jgi:hypothetical protein
MCEEEVGVDQVCGRDMLEVPKYTMRSFALGKDAFQPSDIFFALDCGAQP